MNGYVLAGIIQPSNDSTGMCVASRTKTSMPRMTRSTLRSWISRASSPSPEPTSRTEASLGINSESSPPSRETLRPWTYLS